MWHIGDISETTLKLENQKFEKAEGSRVFHRVPVSEGGGGGGRGHRLRTKDLLFKKQQIYCSQK